MPKVDLQSQIVLTVVGLLVTAALVFVGVSFMGMQENQQQLLMDVTALQSLQETSAKANAQAFKEAGNDLSGLKVDFKSDLRELKSDLYIYIDKLGAR